MYNYNDNHQPSYRGQITSPLQLQMASGFSPTCYVYEHSFQPLYYSSRFSLYPTINYIPQEYMGFNLLPEYVVPPHEIIGLQEVGGEKLEARQNCLETGGKGKRLDSGRVGIRVLDLEYITYECAIEVKPKIAGINTGGTYTLSATKRGASAIWPIVPEASRYVFSVYVQNKTLWVELEMQHRTLKGFPPKFVWRKTWGAKTKIGSWKGLKF